MRHSVPQQIGKHVQLRKHAQRLTIVEIFAVTALLSHPALAQMNVHRGASNADPVFPTLSVMTLNMAKEKKPERVREEWRARPELWNSDVILLQEVRHFSGNRPSIAHTLGKQMNRYVVSAPSLANKDIDGLAIISRYPLSDFELTQLEHNNMVFHTRNRIAIAATVHTPFGPVRVYNVHLDSRINSRTRLRQIAPVISRAADWDGPCIIGGDLNTNYLRWAGNVFPVGMSSQAREMLKAMAARGFATALADSGPTSDFLRLHLDWVYTRDLQAFASAVEPMKSSDHHAVRVILTPKAATTYSGKASAEADRFSH